MHRQRKKSIAVKILGCSSCKINHNLSSAFYNNLGNDPCVIPIRGQLNVSQERHRGRSLRINTNVMFKVVGTRRAVSVVIIKRNRLYQHYRYKQTFSVGDGFLHVPMYKLCNNLYIMANVVRHREPLQWVPYSKAVHRTVLPTILHFAMQSFCGLCPHPQAFKKA